MVSIDDGKIIFDKGEIVRNGAALHIDQGIAVTSHASQAKTVDQVIASVPVRAFSLANKAQFYVSMSRAKLAIHAFTDSKVALRDAVTRPSNRLPFWELLKLAEKDRGLKTELDRQRAKNRPVNKRKLMCDNLIRVPARSLKEQFSRGSEAWKEQSDPIFRFLTEGDWWGFPFFSLSASRYFGDKETLCLYWPLGTLVIAGPKVLDFYAGFCAHRATCLKPDGKDIIDLNLRLNGNSNAEHSENTGSVELVPISVD